MSDRRDRCDTCRFWESDGLTASDALGVADLSDSVVGYCHRHPPSRQVKRMWSLHVLTVESDWCGEWEAIP